MCHEKGRYDNFVQSQMYSTLLRQQQQQQLQKLKTIQYKSKWYNRAHQ
jgi:hypothetical protein